MPAGRSRAKSYIQLRLSAQRAVPCSGQSMSKGSTSRGSPNGTIASLKRAVTCRTPLTVPCGEKASIRGAACTAAADSVSRANRLALRAWPVMMGPRCHSRVGRRLMVPLARAVSSGLYGLHPFHEGLTMHPLRCCVAETTFVSHELEASKFAAHRARASLEARPARLQLCRLVCALTAGRAAGILRGHG